MLINYDSCPILSFLCVETEGTDFYQHNKYFRSVNAYQLLLIFRINLISFIHLQLCYHFSDTFTPLSLQVAVVASSSPLPTNEESNQEGEERTQ